MTERATPGNEAAGPGEGTAGRPRIGDELTVRIDDVAFGGDGVARVNGFVVFVPFALPGEEVRVEIVESKGRFARAHPLEVVVASPHRIEPPCTYYGWCGGCQYQHVDYAAQVEMKRRQVCDALTRIGGIAAPPVRPAAPSPRPYGYRNRITLHEALDRETGRPRIGFFAFDNRTLIDIERCLLAEAEINEQLRDVRRDTRRSLRQRLTLRSRMDTWDVPGESFFQNNRYALPLMIEAVRAAVADPRPAHLADVFCGVGLFAVELAEHADRVTGIDVDEAGIRAAQANARRRGKDHVAFAAGPVDQLLPGILDAAPAEGTAVVLDPPRTGCPRRALDVLVEKRPARIVYVSCNPSTLARDLRRLCVDGPFALEDVLPIDMFPQTAHIECVARLRALSPV